MKSVARISLLCMFSLCVSFVHSQDIDINAWITCVRAPSNVIEARILIQDNNARAVSFDAIAGNGAVMSNCGRSGSGTVVDPWVVETDVSLTDDSETNSCGVQTPTQGQGQGVNRVYRWVFRAYPSSSGGLFQGRSFVLTAECDVNSATASGIVDTSKRFRNLIFMTTPRNPGSATGPNTYASGSEVAGTVTIYGNSGETPTELQGYLGYYITNCYVASDADFTTDVAQYLDENGCPVPNAPITPPPFTQSSLTGEVPLEYSTTYIANTLAGNTRIFHQCDVMACETDDHGFCTGDPCAAYNAGVSPVGTTGTGYRISTSYDVQDKNAQDLFVAYQTSLQVPVRLASAGSSVVLVATGHPYGKNANADMSQATGFYAYSCTYSLTPNFNNPVTFIDAQGCPVCNPILSVDAGFSPNAATSDPSSNTYVLVSGDALLQNINGGRLCPVSNPILSVDAGFSPNAAASDPSSNTYVLVSGDALLQNINGGRLYLRCLTGICTNPAHNYCRNNGRCGATNNLPGQHGDLGFQGLGYDFGIYNANDPAVDIVITGPNGNPTTGNTNVPTGTGLPFNALIVPGGGGPAGDAFRNAAGAYVRTCVTTITKDGRTASYETIDDAGCRVPGTPVRFTEPCTDASNVPNQAPFRVSCGNIVVDDDGEVQTTCLLGLCDNPNNAACDNRCAAGPLLNNPGARDLDIAPSSASRFTSRDRGIGNTAYHSEEIRRILVALAVVLPLVFCACISLFTWCCLRWQKKRKIC